MRTPDETRKAKREQMARKRAVNPEVFRKYQRDFHHKNASRQRKKMRDYYARRFFWAKMTKLRKKGRATHVQLARLWKSQRGLCALTGRRLTRENAEIDHKRPQVRGGGDGIENLQWVCKVANRAKRDLTDEEFLALCREVVSRCGVIR